MIVILGYFAAVLIGISLGLIGGGGSALAIPVLVYLLGYSPVISTEYSFFIVGTSALVGSISYIKTGLINYKSAFYFGIPSLISVFLTRKYILPAIPENLWSVGEYAISKNAGMMVLFSLLMISASVSMISNKWIIASADTNDPDSYKEENPHYLSMTLNGFMVGLFTGLVGIGGGFLIIPGLVVLAKLPMKTAVGTSLLIIAVNSLFGFTEDLNFNIDWIFLLLFSGLAIIGIFLGTYFSKFIKGAKLKTSFGWFILAMGIAIIVKEIVK